MKGLCEKGNEGEVLRSALSGMKGDKISPNVPRDSLNFVVAATHGDGDDSLGSRNAKEVEEQPCKLSDGPREGTEVEEGNAEGHEPDDTGKRVDEEEVV